MSDTSGNGNKRKGGGARPDTSAKRSARAGMSEMTLKCGATNWFRSHDLLTALTATSDRMTALTVLASLALNEWLVRVPADDDAVPDWPVCESAFSFLVTALEGGPLRNSTLKQDTLLREIADRYAARAAPLLSRNSWIVTAATKRYAITRYLANWRLHLAASVPARLRSLVKLRRRVVLSRNPDIPLPPFRAHWAYLVSPASPSSSPSCASPPLNDAVTLFLDYLHTTFPAFFPLDLDAGSDVGRLSETAVTSLGPQQCLRFLKRVQRFFGGGQGEDAGVQPRAFSLAPLVSHSAPAYVQLDASTSFLELAWNAVAALKRDPATGEQERRHLEALVPQPKVFRSGALDPQSTHAVFRYLGRRAGLTIPVDPPLRPPPYQHRYNVEAASGWFYNTGAVRPPRGYLFQGMVASDGAGVSVTLYKPRRFGVPPGAAASVRERAAKRHYGSRLEELDAQGFDAIVGVDPGRRAPATSHTTGDPQLSGDRVLSARLYHTLTGSIKRKWLADKDARARAPPEVVAWHTSSRVSLKEFTADAFIASADAFLCVCDALVGWACDAASRKRRWFGWMNAQRGVHKALRKVIPLSRRKRKKGKRGKKRRGAILVGWGDAGFAMTSRANQSSGATRMRKTLMRSARNSGGRLVMAFVDEFRTSQRCSGCEEHAQLVDPPPHLRPEELSRSRDTDEPTGVSEEERRAVRRKLSAWNHSHRFCPECECVWDRDVNAARNMAAVAIAAMTERRRPPWLRRPSSSSPSSLSSSASHEPTAS